MKFKHFLVAILFTLLSVQFLKAETFKAGSYIIDMGIIPQTYSNGLKPYGMVYDMVINKEVPLYWIIKPGKSLYGTDFTYTGSDSFTTGGTKSYQASSLVLPAIYVTAEVVTAITAWRALGVEIDGPTLEDFDAPVYNYVSSFPNAVVDQQNVALTENLFYNHTSIPKTYYETGTPADIDVCCDVYALPHADPQDWSATDKQTYLDYTDGKAQSFLWQGCHSVGAVEAHAPFLNMDILTTNGQISWKNDPDYEFKNENTPPYNYENSAASHPIMQIASPLDNSAVTVIPESAGLVFTTDVNISVKDDKGFVIKEDFPDINISTNVEIWAKKFELKNNSKIDLLENGSLTIHVKGANEYKNEGCVTLYPDNTTCVDPADCDGSSGGGGGGSNCDDYTRLADGDGVGDKNDGNYDNPNDVITIISDGEYDKFKFDHSGVGLIIKNDVTIKVKDGGGVVFNTDVTISDNVLIWAKKFELKANKTITIAESGSLRIKVKNGNDDFKNNGCITKVQSGGGSTSTTTTTSPFRLCLDGDKSGNGSDGDVKAISSVLTISSNKAYNKFEIEDASGGGGKNPVGQSALLDGSQKIYIPRPDSDWRSTTTVAVWDPTNVNNTLNNNNPKKAALIAFGRAFGDPENGVLVQHASHTASTGTEAQNVSSARIYGNLLLQASIEKRPIVSINAPNSLFYPNEYNMSATVARGAAPFDFEWDITCPGSNDPGTFVPSTQTDVNESNVTFTPNNNTLSNCILRVKVTDFCGRKNFATKILGITGYHPPLGYYNVTHTGVSFPSNQDPLDTSDPVNSLYTQISQKPFNVTLVALQGDKKTLETTKSGNVILELIDTAGVTELEPNSCAIATVYSNETEKITSGGAIQFNNSATATASNISYPNAIKELGFRVSYYDFPAGSSYAYGIPDDMTKAELDNQFPACASSCSASPQSNWDCYQCVAKPAFTGGYGKAVCARDNFAVRPAAYSMGLAGTAPRVGGRDYNLQLNAVKYDLSTIDTWYTERSDDDGFLFAPTADANITASLSAPVPSGCPATGATAPTLSSGNIAFSAGIGRLEDSTPILFRYDNVGMINIAAAEWKWVAKTDMDKDYAGSSYQRNDCIVGSGSNIPDANGKIGCMIMGEDTDLTFIPLQFNNTFSVSNFGSRPFTYVADSVGTDPVYGAQAAVTFTAVLDDGTTTATNYTAGCYADDITSTIKLSTNRVLGWQGTQTRIWLYDADTTTSSTLHSSLSSGPFDFIFKYPESHFNTGVATEGILFNFDRANNTPDNAFNVPYSDFDISVSDDTYTSVTGSDFNRTAGNSNESTTTFYYARTRPSKFFYDGNTASTVKTPIFIDVYCNLGFGTCDARGIDTVNGQIDGNWWKAVNHSKSQGDGNITLSASTNGAVSAPPKPNIDSSGGADKTVVVSKTGGSVPLIVDINFVTDNTLVNYTDAWLIYNKDSAIGAPIPFYQVKFIGASVWSGVGKTGKVINTGAGTKKSKRLDW